MYPFRTFRAVGLSAQAWTTGSSPRQKGFVTALPRLSGLRVLLRELDADFDDDYQRALREENDIEAFRWKLAHAPTDPGALLIAVDNRRTYLAGSPRAPQPSRGTRE